MQSVATPLAASRQFSELPVEVLVQICPSLCLHCRTRFVVEAPVETLEAGCASQKALSSLDKSSRRLQRSPSLSCSTTTTAVPRKTSASNRCTRMQSHFSVPLLGGRISGGRLRPWLLPSLMMTHSRSRICRLPLRMRSSRHPSCSGSRK
jgi:hypothetical protein